MQALPRRSVSHQSTESYKKLPATVWTQTTCRCTQGILFGRGGLAVPDPAHWMVVLALLLLSWLSPTLRMEASHQGMGSRQLLAPPQLTRLELVGVVHGWISKVRAGDGVLASALCVQESHGHTRWEQN